MPNQKSEINSICVFSGSADNLDPVYLDAAWNLGCLLADRKICLVYGAGKTGLMGKVADGALVHQGEVIGIAPENLNTAQLIHQGLTRLEVSDTIHNRKARMYELADAFIALPGGYGTLDELFETLTWAQIGLHTKPVGILNINSYYDPLLAMIERASQEGFIFPGHKALFVSDREPAPLLEKLFEYNRPTGLDHWVNR